MAINSKIDDRAMIELAQNNKSDLSILYDKVIGPYLRHKEQLLFGKPVLWYQLWKHNDDAYSFIGSDFYPDSKDYDIWQFAISNLDEINEKANSTFYTQLNQLSDNGLLNHQNYRKWLHYSYHNKFVAGHICSTGKSDLIDLCLTLEDDDDLDYDIVNIVFQIPNYTLIRFFLNSEL